MNTFKWSEHDFSCKRDGLTIRGKEFRPEGEDLPAVIVSHGYSGNFQGVVNDCKKLASWGYATFCFDFCGGSVPGKGSSDGQTTNMTILTERDDLLAVLDYVKKTSYVDNDKIHLMGFSQGGFVSALAAAKRPKEINSIILFYPALVIPDAARRGALAGSSYDVNNVPEVIDCGKMLLGKAFHDTVVEMDPFEEISTYNGPVLIIHGTEDTTVSYEYAIKAQDAYSPEKCQLQLIKEAGHSFTEKQKTAALTSVHQFLLGKKEILTIDVLITNHTEQESGDIKEVTITFSGSSHSRYFKGNILPGAKDVQTFKNGERIKVRAEYELEGVDDHNTKCQIHIVNQDVEGEWKPIITTDSPSLNFLNHTNLTASLEGYNNGLTVRIYSAL